MAGLVYANVSLGHVCVHQGDGEGRSSVSVYVNASVGRESVHWAGGSPGVRVAAGGMRLGEEAAVLSGTVAVRPVAADRAVELGEPAVGAGVRK